MIKKLLIYLSKLNPNDRTQFLKKSILAKEVLQLAENKEQIEKHSLKSSHITKAKNFLNQASSLINQQDQINNNIIQNLFDLQEFRKFAQLLEEANYKLTKVAYESIKNSNNFFARAQTQIDKANIFLAKYNPLIRELNSDEKDLVDEISRKVKKMTVFISILQQEYQYREKLGNVNWKIDLADKYFPGQLNNNNFEKLNNEQEINVREGLQKMHAAMEFMKDVDKEGYQQLQQEYYQATEAFKKCAQNFQKAFEGIPEPKKFKIDQSMIQQQFPQLQEFINQTQQQQQQQFAKE